MITEADVNILMAEYDQKIAGCDKVINHLRGHIKSARAVNRQSNDNVQIDLAPERRDLAIERARKQAYVQAKYDIDSLIDCLD